MLGFKGDTDVILGPSKLGFTPRYFDHDILAAKLVFSKILQSWRGVPRIRTPAVVCPHCGYLNDEGYIFCQSCGVKSCQRKKEHEGGKNMKDSAYCDRVDFLQNFVDSSPVGTRGGGLSRECVLRIPMRVVKGD